MPRGPIGVRGAILPPYVPAGAVTWPRVGRWHGGLVPAAELLIRLARVEDEPGDPVLHRQVTHDGIS
jgi:hypothetical protein